MTGPNETADLVAEILRAYREHVAADGDPGPDDDVGEENQAEDDPDCE